MNSKTELPFKIDQMVFDAWFMLFILFSALLGIGLFPSLQSSLASLTENKFLYLCLFALAATGFTDYTVTLIVKYNRGDADKSVEETSLPVILMFILISIYFISVCVSVPLQMYQLLQGDYRMPTNEKVTAVFMIIGQSVYSLYLVAVLAYPSLYYDNRKKCFWGSLIFLICGFYFPLYIYQYYYKVIESHIGDFFVLIAGFVITGLSAFSAWKLIPVLLRRSERKTPGPEFSDIPMVNNYLHPSFIAIAVFLWITMFEKNIKEYHFALDLLKGIIPLRILFLLAPPVNYINLAIGAVTIVTFYLLNW